MVFSSLVFLFVFLPLVLAVYFVTPGRLRNLFLLGASLLFYWWGEKAFTLVMLGSIFANYILGIFITRSEHGISRKIIFGTGIVINLIPLLYYKYSVFLLGPGARVFGFKGIDMESIHLPIGISFFTFHAISYLTDLYRGKIEAQKNPIDLGLYIALFPQLVAGPIVRYKEIASQLTVRRVVLDDFAYGVRRFIIGLSKKVLIANTLAFTVDKIFAIPLNEVPAGLVWLGVVLYSLQLFFDFSGYSDMAIGLARMFGFRFPENFNYPYVSRSIQEFWRRWHISLSTWFRDYVYIPLGGNRDSHWRTYRNLMIVFLLCGLWHGASWNFIIFGLIHGTFLIIERFFQNRAISRFRWLGHFYALTVVMLGWVFFRSETFPQACAYLKIMAGGTTWSSHIHPVGLYFWKQTWIAMAAGILFSMPVVPYCREWLAKQRHSFGAGSRIAGEAVACMGLLFFLLLSIAELMQGSYNPFIYFRF